MSTICDTINHTTNFLTCFQSWRNFSGENIFSPIFFTRLVDPLGVRFSTYYDWKQLLELLISTIPWQIGVHRRHRVTKPPPLEIRSPKSFSQSYCVLKRTTRGSASLVKKVWWKNIFAWKSSSTLKKKDIGNEKSHAFFKWKSGKSPFFTRSFLCK